MKLNPEKKTVVILSLISLTTLAIIFGVIWPTINYIKKLENDTTNLRLYLEKKYTDTKNLNTSKEKNIEAQAIVKKYPEYLFYRGDELKLITSLESLANNNQVTQKINSSNLDKLGDTATISLTINGNYQRILEYLSALEKESYYLNITNLQIISAFNQQNNNPEATVMNIDLTLYVNEH